MTRRLALRSRLVDAAGSAPAAVLVWLASALTVLGALALLGQGALAQARAASAADLAALAGADALATGSGSPCATAQEVARRNTAELTDCRVLGQDVLLSVRVEAGALPAARATARAGPGPSGGQRTQQIEHP